MYPKICTHRDDHLAQVVVASQEQYDALPPEYRTDGGYNPFDDEMSHDEAQAEIDADRAQLDKDRLAFSDDLEQAKAELKAERDALDADRAQLEQDKADFAAEQGNQNGEDTPAAVRRGRPPKSAAPVENTEQAV